MTSKSTASRSNRCNARDRSICLRSPVLNQMTSENMGASRTNSARGSHQSFANHLPQNCLWCGHQFTPRCSGGKPQRYCLPACRRAFETAARVYVGRLITAGQLSLGALYAAPATRALPGGSISARTAATLAGDAQSRCVAPIQVLWAGVDLVND